MSWAWKKIITSGPGTDYGQLQNLCLDSKSVVFEFEKSIDFVISLVVDTKPQKCTLDSREKHKFENTKKKKKKKREQEILR